MNNFNTIYITAVLITIFILPFILFKDTSTQVAEPIVEQVVELEFITLSGLATWYDYDLDREDQKCRSQNCYSMFNSTCAVRDYPRGSILKVVNIETQKEVVCRVNDYGPEEWTGKVIDLSSFAFKQIASLKEGVIEVEIRIH